MQHSTSDIAESRINRSNEWAAGTSPASTIITPQLQRILGVWEECRGARTLPARTSLTLPALKFALPQLGILDIVDDGPQTRFRVRLMGGELDRILAPMTGRFIDDAVPSPHLERWTSMLSRALHLRAPIRAASRMEYRDQRRYLVEALVAPLADDGETPDRLLVACYYHLHKNLDENPDEIAGQLIKELDQPANRPT
jgi:hypothetical protein